MEVYIHAVLTLALDGGKFWASHPGHFAPGERNPVQIGGKEKKSLSLPEIEHQLFSP